MINNGVSIYNFGGGGGGYSDGGELVDGDFIDVQNNAISQYENSSRNDINFVVNGDEQINTIIELSTDVNSTIHVYKIDNGLYIPLGNIGGDTVMAGENYNINIIGNSFTIEQISGGGVNPEFASINGVVYSVKVFDNDYVFMTQNLKTAFGESVISVPTTGQTPYDTYSQKVALCNGQYFYKEDIKNKINSSCFPWHIPTDADFSDSSLSTKTCDELAYGGTSGFNAIPTGNVSVGSLGPGADYLYYNNNYKWYYILSGGGAITSYGRSGSQIPGKIGGGEYYSIRLCCKLSDLIQ